MDMPLFAYSLGCMLNEDLERSWAEMQAHIPCVALFEDFDNVFHARENVYGKPNLSDLIASAGAKGGGDSTAAEPAVNTGRLSFDCFLNCLDGVEKSNGVFTVITTNYVDVLDPALGKPVPKADGGIDLVSTRPGRIDKAIELGYMLNSDKLKLAQRILFDNERGLAEIHSQIERDPDRKETPAQFQERCTQLALDMLWAQRQHAHRGNGHAHGNGRILLPSVVGK
jgi:SpoVK/Ycf46/Vps4 family AAA+-type ATPase